MSRQDDVWHRFDEGQKITCTVGDESVPSGEAVEASATFELSDLFLRFHPSEDRVTFIVFDPERRLYAPYFSRQEEGLEFEYIEDSYDYTDERQEWYVQALADGARWSEPYFDTAVGDALMTTYSAVFEGEGAPPGVVTIDVSMDSIRYIVPGLDLGGMGHAVLVSHQVQLLYHPDEELVLGGVNLVDPACASGDVALKALARKILEGG